MAVVEVADRVGSAGEGVGAVDDGLDGAGLDEPGQSLEVLGAFLGDQGAEPLRRERREQRRAELPVEAAEQWAAGVLGTD